MKYMPMWFCLIIILETAFVGIAIGLHIEKGLITNFSDRAKVYWEGYNKGFDDGVNSPLHTLPPTNTK